LHTHTHENFRQDQLTIKRKERPNLTRPGAISITETEAEHKHQEVEANNQKNVRKKKKKK
jgi:hypothetical protein